MRPPPGFTLTRRRRCRVLVREDVAAALGPWLLEDPLERPPGAEAVHDGRGGAYRCRLADVPLVVREYRRGGWVGRWIHGRYLGLRPRPFRELIVTEAARRRGLPTVEVLAARVVGTGIYAGTLVTAELRDATPLLEALRASSDTGRRRTLVRAAGRLVGQMHRLGLHHRDLNCTNLLIAGAQGEVHVIDLDRASLRAQPLGDGARRRTLRRLGRSLSKLDRDGVLVPAALQTAFKEGYAETGGGRCAC